MPREISKGLAFQEKVVSTVGTRTALAVVRKAIRASLRTGRTWLGICMLRVLRV